MNYDHKKIESKWQNTWLKDKVFAAADGSKKEKFYQLETFPYPSAAGLHVGHPKGYIAEDIHARFMRMNGREVLYTMGWDAFGLPTENYAIKVGKSPKEVAAENIANFKRQVRMFGLSYDWDREINTSAPEYYKWTQWLFIQLFKKGLAYRAKARVNWCPQDQTVLANEQVLNGKCERCGADVEQKEMEQWFLKITAYAERLLKDLKGLDWPAASVKRQEDWIGKSDGALLKFPIKLNKDPNFIILHGFTGSPDINFIPALKKKLETQGYKVQAPELPNTDKPKENEQVKYVLKNCKIDENTILIGHSLGGLVAMKVLQQHGKPISGLVLVASVVEPRFRTNEHEYYWDTFSWDFDYELLKKLSPIRTVISDIQETRRAVYLEYLANKLNANLVIGKAEEEHFCAKKEPIIEENIIPNIEVFTTRPDTLFGATYMVLAPEHPIIQNLESRIENLKEVKKYISETLRKTELMRQEKTEKIGVELKGIKAINPATKEEVPVWIADYVLMSYGTGAIMAVPGHDERDYEFAKKFGLPIKIVIQPETGEKLPNEQFRRSIVAIVEDPKTHRFLTLNWGPKYGGTLFIGGGHEGEEDEVQAALREIGEETGYTKVEFVGKTEKMRHHYFAFSKGVGRDSEVIGLHFRLTGEDIKEQKLDDHEHDKFKIEWLTANEVISRMEDENHILCFRRLILKEIYSGNGLLMNSGKFDGLDSLEAKKEITKAVGGKIKVEYKLRDWSVSRQRYWGCPIPMVHCAKCGISPVAEKNLPVLLPDLDNYRPKGKPPLASSEAFLNVECPNCGGEAKRDPETLDTFVDSSWYYLRYTDPHNKKEPFAKKKAAHWMPVDLYIIGAEHTVLHLLYSRFITKFLKDEGYFDFEEPFLKLRHVGLILGADGQKMSKSKGNVVNPDELIAEFGADTVRLYEMFMGPFENGQPWDPQGVLGAERFLKRIWNYAQKSLKGGSSDKKTSQIIHRAVKKVGEDIAGFKFNTAISALMILLNEIEDKEISLGDLATLLKIIHPFAPHLAQELWSQMGKKTILDFEPWPQYDPELVREEKISLVLQVNGKVRDIIDINPQASEAEVKDAALESDKIKKALAGAEPKKFIYVPGKVLNIVI